jgi:membrane dipeptidase
VIDLHVDLSYQVNYRGQSLDRGTGQYRARDLQRAGVLGVVLPLYVPRNTSPTGPRLTDLEQSYARMFGLLNKTAPYALPGCVERPGAVKTWFAFEGAAPLADTPESVLGWVARGVRIFGLVHTYENALSTSSGSASKVSTGLTKPGRVLVERIHAAGGIVDVSHASDRATDEIIRLATAAGRPVVATHSNARAIAAHPRNLTDQQIRAIAATGGVVGVNFHSPFLARKRAARIEDVVQHVRHIVRLVGADHVAIGSDFEGDIRPPPGLEDVTGFQGLAHALAEAGLSREQIERILWRNAHRLLCAEKRTGAPDRP